MKTPAWQTGPMLFVDCPICDGPVALDAALARLDCPACGVSLEIAADELATLGAAA